MTFMAIIGMAIIGMMGLIGMMVKNAIVLVDEINRLQTEEKRMPYTAVIEAYEALEEQHIRIFGERKYSEYDSFRGSVKGHE